MPSKTATCTVCNELKLIRVRNMCKACYERFRRSHSEPLSSQHGVINDISNVDAAYIAGMIDADGMITVSSPHRPKKALTYVPRERPLVVVTNSDMGLINWLKEAIGAGTSYETKTQPTRADQDKNNWNKVHRFQITGFKAISLLEIIQPHLKIKKKQAKLVMQMPVRGRDFMRQATEEQLKNVEEITSKLRLMNRRGFKKHCLFGPLLL